MKNESTAYISLGSNLGDSVLMLKRAVAEIGALGGCRILAESRIYLTEPQGLKNQPWFANQVIKAGLGGEWEPIPFLAALLAIETRLGRDRKNSVKNGPRLIDADLLLFNDAVLEGPFCVLPHPEMCSRAFVLAPLAELAPALLLNGKTPASWLAALSWRREGYKIYQ